jgi:hypothetical protein
MVLKSLSCFELDEQIPGQLQIDGLSLRSSQLDMKTNRYFASEVKEMREKNNKPSQ